MPIAYLAWGSLIQQEECLKVRGSWTRTGPHLPVEFARISDNLRVTLVLHPDALPVQTYVAEAAHETLEDAIENLRLREGHPRCTKPTRREWVAAVRLDLQHQEKSQLGAEAAFEWLKTSRFDAAVWTAIPSRLEHAGHRINSLTVDGVVSYLRSLPKSSLGLAREYFKSIPLSIQTGLRREIEEQMGWQQTPDG